MADPIRVVELFAGVGGFNLGLTTILKDTSKPAWRKSNVLADPNARFKVIFSNQWEPSSKRQHAIEVYRRRFTPVPTEDEKVWTNKDGDEISVCEDINELASPEMTAAKVRKNIPEHDLLVGGFPCQDYSVARTLKGEGGIQGKKGVLWWNIHSIIKARKPRFVLLENVDRLLKSPSSARGRDFAIMLSTFAKEGYAVEWRVVNAADYGMPQRRRRVFIFAERIKGSSVLKRMKDAGEWNYIHSQGPIAIQFPVKDSSRQPGRLDVGIPMEIEPLPDLPSAIELSENYEDFQVKCFGKSGPACKSPFQVAGMMRPIGKGKSARVHTIKTEPEGEWGWLLKQVIEKKDDKIPEEFWISKSDLSGWQEQKGSKAIERTTEEGHTYLYSEGGMLFPDPTDRPSRTIITGEGGRSPSRFKHAILTKSGRHRRLIPRELERLNEFPDDWTEGTGEQPMVASKRAFLMGNALVVGIIRRFANAIDSVFE